MARWWRCGSPRYLLLHPRNHDPVARDAARHVSGTRGGQRVADPEHHVQLCPHSFVGAERESTANRLGLVFAITGFTTVLAMLVVQLAVGAGIGEITRDLDEQTARALRRGLRMVDLGLDVAWDMLIGTALVCSGFAMRQRSGLGPAWAIPSIALGVALIGLNAATFPWPPGDRGLFDIGPLIGVFVLVLSARLAYLGRRA